MHGALADTPPADLFARLAEQSATGTLTLTGPDGEATVRFVHGTIAGARPPADGRGLRLGQRLVHAGRLEPDDLERVLAEQAAASAPVALGHLLVEHGMVPADVVRVLLQEQTLDALDPLVQWRTGHYAFEVDPAPAGVRVALPVDRALAEIRRRARERERVRQVVPGPGAVPRPAAPSSPETRMSPDAVSVLTAVDGQASVDGIAATLGYGYDEASRIVYRLALQGLVAFADDQPSGPAHAGRAAIPEAPMPSPADPAPTASAPPADDDEPQPWIGWARGAPAEDDEDAGTALDAPTGGAPGAPAPAPGEPEPEPTAAPAADEDVRRALFSELHAVSRAEPERDRPPARPAPPAAGPADARDGPDEPPEEEGRPRVEEPDDEQAAPRMPDLSSDEVSSLLRELHDLNRGDD